MNRNRRMKWSDSQFARRRESLQKDGFTADEAWDIAQWNHPLNHFVIAHLRRNRRVLIRNLLKRGMGSPEIQEYLDDRYQDLGIKGQYENEDWYVSRAT